MYRFVGTPLTQDIIERIFKKFLAVFTYSPLHPLFPSTPENRILFAVPYVSGKAIGQENLLLYTKL